MGTKQIRVSEDLYARVKSENRGDETLGETLERLVGGYSLTDFADDAADLDLAFSVEEATDGTGGATPPAPEDRA
jgi:predicted CopG family antitoxin